MLVPHLGGGGAERVMTHLANGLIARGHKLDMVMFERRGPYLTDLHPAARVIDLRAKEVHKGIRPLAAYLRVERPGAVVSALDHANAAALLARLMARVPVPVVLTVHAAHSRTQATANLGARGLAVRQTIRWAYPMADAVVAVSKGTADDMIASTGVPRGLVRVIYNPVINPEVTEQAREVVDHPWYGPGEPPVIVAMGRLQAPKDFDTVLRAFAFAREHRDLRLMILGEGGERRRLESLVSHLGLAQTVAMPGFVRNPFAFLGRASLFVLSSVSEALPTALIEALALGIPVVSTDCRSGPAEILQGGRYGNLVPVGDADAMAGALLAELAHPHPTPPASVLRPFTVEAALDAYEDLVLSLTQTEIGRNPAWRRFR